MEQELESIAEATKKQKLLDDRLFTLLMYIVFGVICCTISFAGLFTNIVTIATFVKLGFKETVNISLTALAITDFASLICVIWEALCFVPSFSNMFEEFLDARRVAFYFGGIERVYFTIVGGCITAVVAFERCLCVIRPLQVKVIFTRGRLVCILIGVFTLALIPFIPIFFTTGMDWVFNPETNKTILSLTRKTSKSAILSDAVSYGVISFGYVATYIVVFTCTATIVGKLASQSAWRAGKSKGNDHGSGNAGQQLNQQSTNASNSDRDKRAANTVTLIATMYIVCFLPGAAITLTKSFVPEFGKGMLYENTFEMSWGFAHTLECICSSANILVYLKTSVKFREAFLEMFKRRK